MKQISAFANSMGQAPELYEGEHIYQYDNKMIRIGIIDGILYMKMLDYEQTEGYAYEMNNVREFFNDALLGLFAQTHNEDVNGYFDFGLTSSTAVVTSIPTSPEPTPRWNCCARCARSR